MTLYTTYTYTYSELLYQWNHIKHKTISEFEQSLFWTILIMKTVIKNDFIIFWTNENKNMQNTVFTTFVKKKLLSAKYYEYYYFTNIVIYY